MPYTVAITADEAKLLTEANVAGVEGTIFTFEPRDSMHILSRVADASDSEDPGRSRLADRLATLYGQHLTKVRNSESAQELPLFAAQPYVSVEQPIYTPPPADDLLDAEQDSPLEQDAATDEPVEEPAPVAPTKRKRGQ